jgi:hypothetical protein
VIMLRALTTGQGGLTQSQAGTDLEAGQGGKTEHERNEWGPVHIENGTISACSFRVPLGREMGLGAAI